MEVTNEQKNLFKEALRSLSRMRMSNPQKNTYRQSWGGSKNFNKAVNPLVEEKTGEFIERINKLGEHPSNSEIMEEAKKIYMESLVDKWKKDGKANLYDRNVMYGFDATDLKYYLKQFSANKYKDFNEFKKQFKVLCQIGKETEDFYIASLAENESLVIEYVKFYEHIKDYEDLLRDEDRLKELYDGNVTNFLEIFEMDKSKSKEQSQVIKEEVKDEKEEDKSKQEKGEDKEPEFKRTKFRRPITQEEFDKKVEEMERNEKKSALEKLQEQGYVMEPVEKMEERAGLRKPEAKKPEVIEETKSQKKEGHLLDRLKGYEMTSVEDMEISAGIRRKDERNTDYNELWSQRFENKNNRENYVPSPGDRLMKKTASNEVAESMKMLKDIENLLKANEHQMTYKQALGIKNDIKKIAAELKKSKQVNRNERENDEKGR